MAESFSREKLRQAPQKEGGWKNPVLPSSCVTPAGKSIEVQNEWEENTQYCTTKRSGLTFRSRSAPKICFNVIILIIFITSPWIVDQTVRSL